MELLKEIVNLNLSRELITVVIAMVPVFELRAALPVSANVLHLSWYQAFYLSVIGNLIPVPFLLLFFNGVSKLIQNKSKTGKRFIDWILHLGEKRSEIVEKYKLVGLALFVAIPLPATGAWTASLVSCILGLKFWPAFAAIIVGVICAGIIVATLTVLGWLGAGIAVVALIILAIIGVWKL
jgi:uncharacterized membrane protein